ncbi:hypothetical protein, conserved [Babesia ovata]|uniref:6-Cys domain-containing protein n=1 Tax=Babesia ovata TaxID=189622 RepID=A0A2H6KE88_9APIC|nr:uncharacterized protein BOVATA_028040 [Babesia ovata]GBE61311.1 hypothetical protein, conserved [Babesia ovata]
MTLPTVIGHEFVCNFGGARGFLSTKALVSCHAYIQYNKFSPVICPHQVNDIEYVWHPQTKSDDQSRINAYVCENGRFCSVALSDVVRTEAPRSLFRMESSESHSTLHLDLTHDDIYTIIERRLVFLCGPRDLVLSDALQRHLDRLDYLDLMDILPWSPVTPLVQEIAKIGTGLGMLILYRGLTHLPLQGCGSRPSPLFAEDNEVVVDAVTGIRSCLADPMLKAPIGFLCDGRLEPDDCMRSLLDNHGRAITAPSPHKYWEFEHHEPWVVAQYFNDFALPPINGECRCINPETGQLKARIEIRSKTDYICDIASKVLQNRFHPIHGPWCSVMLHPGSTLTIRLPAKIVNSTATDGGIDGDIDEDFSALPFSQLPSVYEYETDFMPKDLITLRQLKTVGDINTYDEIPYYEALVGDALELDVSQISQGEVKLKYQLGKPLALRERSNSFFYHWTLISRNESVPDKIRAIVNVAFTFTHRYKMIGCDRGPHSVFDPKLNKRYCSLKSMGNGIGDIYECLFNQMWDRRLAGIHCRPDEDLLPNNCESVGYNLVSNHIMPFTESMRSAMPYPIQGFKVFKLYFTKRDPVGYACICVDQRGYETSRLILESNAHATHTYLVRREEASQTLIPYLLLPWHEVEFSSRWLIRPKPLMLNDVSQKSVTLQVGEHWTMHCEFHPELRNFANNGISKTTWLPKQPEEYYYTVNYTTDGPELFRRRYRDSIATTPGGLKVRYERWYNRPNYHILTINFKMTAVLISKDPLHKKYVPMTFVCGKALQPSDLSTVTGNPSTSGSTSLPNMRSIWSTPRYTWNVVEVAVETTDPHMQGCGVTYASDELFKPETPQLYDADGQPQFGCKIDLQAAKEAAFYCPAPYVLDPPNCFSQVSVGGLVTNVGELSQSLVASRSNHFVILSFDDSLVGPGETLRQTPPLQCRCVTVKGIVLSTIQIENYYAK